jgi:sirohydrochlorin cobaltochelatase
VAPALVVIGHGTRDPGGAEEMEQFVEVLRAHHPGVVAHAWLEDFADPGIGASIDALAANGVRHLATVPFLNLGARHAKTDIPTELATAQQAHPELAIAHGRPLGLHPSLFALARQRVAAVSPEPDEDEALVVTASGSSDPDANGDLAKAARFLAEGTGHRWIEHAFAGVTWPDIETALTRLAAAGARRVVIFSWSLLAGRLETRVSETAHAVAGRVGLELVEAGRFGPEPLVAEAVADRYHEALSGDVRMNCDLCAYRVPLPGLEDRVGAPSGGGTGTHVPHSHH